MFEIAGLFLNDRSSAHLEAVKSLSNYFDNLLGEQPTPNALYAMQQEVYKIHEVGVNSLERAVMSDRGFDCTGGCDSCCHATDVGLTPTELFYLANHIAQNKLHMREGEFSISRRNKERDPCPLLNEGWCTVYEGRPLSCRYILSTDVNSCLKRKMTLTGGAKLPPPFSHFRSSIAAAQFILFRKRGLDARWLVMDHSIQTILETENAVSKWLSGEKFSGNIHKLEEPCGNFSEIIAAAEALN